jgi:hypothetical protein
MPLWMSSRVGLRWLGSGLDELVDLAGDVAFKAAAGFALRHASGEVGAAAGLPAESGEHDRVQRAVGLPVTAAVEPASEVPPLARRPTIMAVGREGSLCGSTEEVSR